MTTVVTPGGGRDEGAGLGLVMGVILTIAVIALLVIFGLPGVRGSQAPATPQNDSIDVNVKLPTNDNGGTDTPAPTTP